MTTEVGFYHLTRTGAEAALATLLARTLDAGERALIRVPDAARAVALDTALWAAAEPWLPHGTEAVAPEHATLQPIWIAATNAPPPNGARYLFLLGGAGASGLDRFARVFDLFDGTDPDAVAAARRRWQGASGFQRTYWQQGPRGWRQP